MLFNANLVTDDPRDLVRLRHSHLECFRDSPATFYALHIGKTMEESEPSQVMRVGLAFDSLLLATSAGRVLVIDDKLSRSTSKANMAKKEKIKADAVKDGKVWLTATENERVQRMLESAQRNRDIQALLAEFHEAQKQVLWECEWTRFPKRGTLDYLGGCIADIKTTGSWNLHPRRLPQHIWQFGNHRQLAHYQEGVEAATGERLDAKLIYIGSEPPYETVVIDVGQNELDIGRRENREACLALEEAWAYNSWTSWHDKRLILPGWAYGVPTRSGGPLPD